MLCSLLIASHSLSLRALAAPTCPLFALSCGKLRRARLRYFSRPIFFASCASVAGNLLGDALIVEDEGTLFTLRAWLWIVMLLPCLIVICLDTCSRKEPPRFSVTHAIFFITVL